MSTAVHREQRTRSVPLMVLLCALWASMFVATRSALRHGDPMALAAFRHIVGGVLLMGFIRVTRGRFPARPPSWPLAAFILFQIVGVQGLLFAGLEHLTAGVGASLLYFYPAFTAVLAALFLGERLSALNGAGLGLGVAGTVGIVVVGGGWSAGFQVGHVLIIGASLCWAIATIVLKRYLGQVDAIVLNAWALVVGGLMLVEVALLSGQTEIRFTLELAVSMTWLIGPSLVVAMTLWYGALTRGTATQVTSFLFLVPAMSFAFAWAVLGEGILLGQLVAALVIACGVRLATRP